MSMNYHCMSQILRYSVRNFDDLKISWQINNDFNDVLNDVYYSSDIWIKLIQETIQNRQIFGFLLPAKAIVKLFESKRLIVGYDWSRKEINYLNAWKINGYCGQYEKFFIEIIGIFDNENYLRANFDINLNSKKLKIVGAILERGILKINDFDLINHAVFTRDDDFFHIAVKHQRPSEKSVINAFRTGYCTAMKYFLKGHCLGIDIDFYLAGLIVDKTDEEILEILSIRKDFDAYREFKKFSNLFDYLFWNGKKKSMKFLLSRNDDKKYLELLEFIDSEKEIKVSKFSELFIFDIDDYQKYREHYRDLFARCDNMEIISRIIKNTHKLDNNSYIYLEIVYPQIEKGLVKFDFDKENNYIHNSRKFLTSVDVTFENQKHKLDFVGREGNVFLENILEDFREHKNVSLVKQVLELEMVDVYRDYKLTKYAIENKDREFFDLVIKQDELNEGLFVIALYDDWEYPILQICENNPEDAEEFLYVKYYEKPDKFNAQELLILHNMRRPLKTFYGYNGLYEYLKSKEKICVIDLRKKYIFKIFEGCENSDEDYEFTDGDYYYNEKTLNILEYCIEEGNKDLMKTLQKFYNISINEIMNDGYLSTKYIKKAQMNSGLFMGHPG